LPDPSLRQAFGWGVFLVNFSLAKGAIYVAPLGVAAIASPETYGAVELAWSFGLILGSITISVPISGINQRFLVSRDREIGDEVSLLLLVFAALSLAATALAFWIGATPIWTMIAAAFGSTALHSVSVSIFRMYGRPNLSAWSDGTAMLCTAAILLVCMLSGAGVTVANLTTGYLVLGAATTAAAAIGLIRLRRPALLSRLKRSTLIGLPMVIGGLMALWLGVGGRLTIGALLPAGVALYSIAFRVAGLALGLHQMATTLFYARLYASRTRDADALVGRFYAAVLAFSVLMALFGAPVVSRLDLAALPSDRLATFAVILPIVSVQIFFWIGFAMLQTRINRSRLAGRSIRPLALVTAVGGGLIFAAAAVVEPDIIWLCWGIALHAATYFVAAYVLLARRRLPHVRMGAIGLFGGALLILLALATHLLV
jgi:hypothetical protein